MISPQHTRAALLAFSILTAVATVRVDAQRYPVRHYTVDDGLPSAHVHDVAQDRRGLLWLATRAGVARYDGRRFKTYNLNDGFAWADQLALSWDGEGVLWSVSARAPFHLHHFDGERWRSDLAPEPFAEDEAMTVRGFAVLDAGDARTFALGTDRGLLYHEGDSWRRPTRAGQPAADAVTALVERDGRLLVATRTGVALLLDGALVALTTGLPPDLLGLAVESAAAGGVERVWLVGRDWIGELRDGQTAILAEGLALSASPTPLVTAPDYRGGLYLGGPDALYHFHPADGLTPIGRDNGLGADGATALLVDRENHLWVGSEMGVSKLVSRRFATYSRRHGLWGDEVTAALTRADGRVVLGHRGGLTTIDSRGVRSRPLTPPAASAGVRMERVADLAEDGEGRLWIAAGAHGLARLGENGAWRWFGPDDGLEGDVTSVAIDTSGELWAATDRGLFRRRGVFERPPGGPVELHVRRVLPAADGGLLLATARGLYRVADGRWQRWCKGEEDACGSVFAALERADGTVWAGTSDGLYGTRGEELAPVTKPRIERSIYFIVRDREGRFWFGTDDGVLRWDGEQMRHFTLQDGLAGRETQRAAGMIDDRGRIWIGTENGVTVYAEPPPGRDRAPPLIELEQLEVGDRRLTLDAPLRLGSDENDLAFRFRVISFADPGRIDIRSRLEGYQERWHRYRDGAPWELRYGNLSPGSYRLHLRATSDEGVESDVVRSAAIVIARPFWQQPWFLLALALAVGGSAYGGRRLLSQQRRARWLEAEVERRMVEVTAEQERLMVTLRNIADGVITTDADGTIIFLNPMALEISGWTQDEAVGEPLERVLLLRQRGGRRERYDLFGLLVARNLEALERTETVELETRSGERRLIEISGSPIVQSRGQHAGLVVAFHDVSEKYRLEQDLLKAQKLEALSILAGGIAHDFNNLLTVLLGSISLLEARGLDAASGQHLRAAEAAVLRARDLTQQLLTFARGGTPVREAASISEVIRESTAFVLRGANVRCAIDLPDDLWVVEIDAGQINQVLNNLLINAMQAMPEGGTVRIVGRNVLGPAARLPGPRYVAIEIHDEGVGIAEEDLGRIFDPYFSTKGTGRGLGLASAYSIVRQHEGTLTVTSELEAGTAFHLYLPATDARPAEPSGVDLTALNGAGRVLIMDDDDAVRATTGAMVEQLGYRVAYAVDGDEAIVAYREALARDEPFSAVIMDLTIPGGMGGKEAIRRLRGIDPEVRAIVASGYSNDPVLAQHHEHGFDGRITKPFRATDLARVLDQVLS